MILRHCFYLGLLFSIVPALAGGRQYQAWLGDGRVVYWVEQSQPPAESRERNCRIEFEEDDEDGEADDGDAPKTKAKPGRGGKKKDDDTTLPF